MRWSMFLLIWPVCLAAAITPVGAQSPATPEFVKVYGPHTVGQTFQYPASNLDRIGLWVRKPAVANHHDLVVRVRKSSSARRDIVVIRTPVASLVAGDIQWVRFRPLGDDEVPTFYVQVESPGSTEANAPEVRVERGPVAGTVGPVEMDGVARDGALTIHLATERSIWTRIGYVLARFEVDKPWFYNRYFFVTLFAGYLVLLAGFLRHTFRLLWKKSPRSGETTGVSRTFMGCVLGLFVVRGILYSSLFPAWQAPDEPTHFATIRYFVEHRALPDVETAQIDRDVLESMDRADYAVILKGGRPRPDWQTWIEDPRDVSVRDARAWMTTSVLPFLYHVVASIPYRWVQAYDTTSQLYLLRLFSVCLSCGVVLIAWCVARLLYPDDRSCLLLVPAILCFLPMFTYMSSVVSYDSLTNLFCTGAVFLLARALVEGVRWRDAIVGGVCIGGALLTKGAILLMLPAVAVWWVIACWRSPEKRKISLRLLVGTAIAGSLGGWWYLRNQWRYGHVFPAAKTYPSWTSGEFNVDLGLGTPAQFGGVWPEADLLTRMGDTVSGAFNGMVGVFGWGNAPLHPWMYTLTWGIFVCACCGGLLECWRMIQPIDQRTLPRKKAAVWLALVVIIYTILLMTRMGRNTQGRYLFPVVVPAVCWFARGLWTLIPPKSRSWGSGIIIGGLILFDSLVILETIIPRYYLIPPPSKLLTYLH